MSYPTIISVLLLDQIMLQRPFARGRTILTRLGTHQTGKLSVASARRRSLTSAADLRFGQPLHETHPHLLKAGERSLLPSSRTCNLFNEIADASSLFSHGRHPSTRVCRSSRPSSAAFARKQRCNIGRCRLKVSDQCCLFRVSTGS